MTLFASPAASYEIAESGLPSGVTRGKRDKNALIRFKIFPINVVCISSQLVVAIQW